MTVSAQFRTSSVRELKNRGRLKRSRGFSGALFEVFGSLPRRKFKATTTAIDDPAI